MKYIAHKRNETDNVEQLLSEHLKNTADMCSDFAECIGMSDYGEMVGWLHDIGKYSEKFQKRINGEAVLVDHSTCGAQEAFKRQLLMASLCIAGHHGGIPDIGSKSDLSDVPTLIGRIKRKTEDFSFWKKELEVVSKRNTAERRFSDNQSYAFLTKVMFSCLVDADYLDTEKFMSNKSIFREKGKEINILLKSLNNYISKWKNPSGRLNILRSQMLNECIEAGQNSSDKFFTLTVPTGGGKTVSSMAFALNYAARHNKKRVIYVIPYTSIIEQNAGVFRNIFDDENVLENHSNVDFSNYSEEMKIQKMLAGENWDLPIVVTTAVQFFESIFSNKPSRCRKIHNIADSVIIFDEAQMLPIDYLLPCVSAMKQLAENCNSAVVLCTATQPNLDTIFDILTKKKEKVKFTEICKSSESLTDDFRRAEFKYEGKLEDDEIVYELSNCAQVLCIVNKKSHAQKLYSMLDESEENFHLSTYMYPSHRKKVIENIRQRLTDNKPCRVISTSLIEAGVDIDFPVVYRAVSGIDSILQAGGRCNRENNRKASDSVVHIFDTDEIVSYQQINTTVAMEVIKKYDDKIYLPEAVKMYFDKLYYYKDVDSTHKVFDKKEILKGLDRFEFNSVAKKFKLIENNTVSVIISTEENKHLIKELRNGKYTRELFRRLQLYTVNLYEYDFNRLDEVCAIEYVDDSFYVLSDRKFYNDKMGIKFPDANAVKGIFL